MRILLDTRICRGWNTGIGRYAVELIRALSRLGSGDQLTVIVSPDAPRMAIDASPRVRTVPIALRAGSPRQHLLIPRLARFAQADLVHSLHPTTTSLIRHGRSITNCYDLHPIHYPRAFSPVVPLYFRTIVPAALARQNRVLACSEFTRQDLIATLGVTPGRITTVPLGVAAEFSPVPPGDRRDALCARHGLHRRFVLYHGNKRPHKNLPTLLAAFALVRDRHPGALTLAITGREDPREREGDFSTLRREIARHRLEPDVTLTGFVADRDLPAIYSAATVTVVPSYLEGFGLPVLESLACGTPAVIARSGALPEVAGDAAAIVAPDDPVAMADAIESIAFQPDRRAELAVAGIARARRFTWAATAAAVYDAYREVAHR